MFLTDILFNSPRLWFSEMQKKVILCWGKDMGAVDVPTLKALQKIQETLSATIGNLTTAKRTCSRNLFYINEIYHAITKVSKFPFYP